NQLGTLTAQRDGWLAQRQEYEEQLGEAEIELEELGARAEGAQIAVEAHAERVPELEALWRQGQERANESRARIMQVQQRIELASAHQRNAANILTSLAGRRERLQQERNGLNLPDGATLDNLRLQLEEKQLALEEQTMLLEEASARQDAVEQERKDAHAQVQQESATSAQLEARLAALRQV
ncbi:chromosome segregation protein SMC, partial [Halobellus sp. Atlit-31R]